MFTPLDEDDVHRAVRHLKDQGVVSIAVTLLHSAVNPAHERRIGEIIAAEAPGTYVALSSSVLPVSGETERWSTTHVRRLRRAGGHRLRRSCREQLADSGFQAS
ncbi:MAG: hydantoinase/oxoprolinase N-terminal domain-containing protein [Steroidobacteraceae bacterium]